MKVSHIPQDRGRPGHSLEYACHGSCQLAGIDEQYRRCLLLDVWLQRESLHKGNPCRFEFLHDRPSPTHQLLGVPRLVRSIASYQHTATTSVDEPKAYWHIRTSGHLEPPADLELTSHDEHFSAIRPAPKHGLHSEDTRILQRLRSVAAPAFTARQHAVQIDIHRPARGREDR